MKLAYTQTRTDETLDEPGSPTPGPAFNVRLLNTIIKWSFLAFVFSIPFEVVDPFGVAEVFSISKFFGFQFLIVSMLRPSRTFARPPLSFWMFFSYIALLIVFSAFESSRYAPQQVERILTLSQLLVLFWVSTNLLRDEEGLRGAILALGFSCTLVALLRILGFAASGQQYGVVLRASAFNQNPNGYATTLAVGLLAMVGGSLTVLRSTATGSRIIYWGCAALLGLEIIRTGSRGAALALVVGLVVLLIQGGPGWWKIAKGLAIPLLAVLFIWGPFSSETSRTRWQETLDTGDLAGRDEIFSTALQMTFEKPLIGWGPVAHLYEIGRRLHYPGGFRDPHNLYLWLLTETGILGTGPFLFGLWLCIKGAWRARFTSQGMLPLALVSLMLTVCLVGSLHFTKLFWLVMAYAVASGNTAPMSESLLDAKPEPNARGNGFVQ